MNAQRSQKELLTFFVIKRNWNIRIKIYQVKNLQVKFAKNGEA
jgi:hypothetical protein